MKTLYESILSSTGSGLVGKIKDIFAEKPSINNANLLTEYWNALGLGLKGCGWLKSSLNNKSYIYKGYSKQLIIINFNRVFNNRILNLICTKNEFEWYTTISNNKISYEKWITKIKEKLNANIKDIPNTNNKWNELELK